MSNSARARKDKIAARVIWEHFGQCSGDPESWDARRLALRMYLNEMRGRVGEAPIPTASAIGRTSDPAIVAEMATAAFEEALDAVDITTPEYAMEWDEAIRYAATDEGAFVYFIQAVNGGLIKIGKARDISARLAMLQSGSPVILRVLAFQHGGRPLEVALHRRFAADRLHGEWFTPSEALLAYIEGLGTPDA